jgi:uncharacterized FlaG/YvyC family protein
MLIQSSSNIAPSVGLASSGAPSSASGNSPPPGNNVAQVSQEQQGASPAQLQNAISSLNNVMQSSNVSLSFSLDSGTDTPVVNVTDTETGKQITQFPSKAMLAIAAAIDASQKRLGVLFNQKA